MEAHSYNDHDVPTTIRAVLAIRGWDSPLQLETIDLDPLSSLISAFEVCHEQPYSAPLHLYIATLYSQLGYPDLAAGSAYKALYLVDAIDDSSDEYHEAAKSAVQDIVDRQPTWANDEVLSDSEPIIRDLYDGIIPDSEDDEPEDLTLRLWTFFHYRRRTYQVLISALTECGCLRSAQQYLDTARRTYARHLEFTNIANDVQKQVRISGVSVDDVEDWPDTGLVKREVYPWNEYEPDRLRELDLLNELMRKVSDKLEVRVAHLPALEGQPGEISSQLGVFAKQDIYADEIVLDETSYLTANNRLQDALCDACSADLPSLSDPASADTVSCEDCAVVFCSARCHDDAKDLYHGSLCERDLEATGKDTKPAEAADSLYSLLLLRTFALADTQSCHPLDLDEVKYIWGDFQPSETSTRDTSNPIRASGTLPFSYHYNIHLPFHMLTKMDLDIFALPWAEVWVFNTLYAKFRGTASARFSKPAASFTNTSSATASPILTKDDHSTNGQVQTPRIKLARVPRGPEVSAVHPLWCLANHSCAPNVTWDWGGSIQLRARRRSELVRWGPQFNGLSNGADGKVEDGNGTGIEVREVVIRKGEEILNHYCDVALPVKERREWARGALGGDCRCERCLWEAEQE